jgi:brefeldin A-inhibited guanine nucleotide-exchange protein 3
VVAAFLQHTNELAFFHLNEALFKPFENLVCLELCDADVQDQIVASICEFVETNTAEINSGWRSLFGTLKSVHFPVELKDPDASSQVSSPPGATQHESHWRAVQDVFEAFLATESPQANKQTNSRQLCVHLLRPLFPA